MYFWAEGRLNIISGSNLIYNFENKKIYTGQVLLENQILKKQPKQVKRFTLILLRVASVCGRQTLISM